MKPIVQLYSSPNPVKFAPSDKKHGEVKTYYLSKEEIRKRYGPSPMDILTRELYQQFKAERLTQQQMAEKTGLTLEQVNHIVSHYCREGRKQKLKVKEVKKPNYDHIKIKAKSLEELTVEEYLVLKKKNVPDRIICKHISVYNEKLSAWKKKNGLTGVKSKYKERIQLI